MRAFQWETNVALLVVERMYHIMIMPAIAKAHVT